ncbi:hypothetical protein JCM3774_003496 [Rhodotorula dairenensis]
MLALRKPSSAHFFDLLLRFRKFVAAMTSANPLPGDTLSFPTNHKLLNGRFESYKLAPLPRGDDAVISTPLPKPFVLPETAAHARLSYQQVADRARHNHLKAGPDGELVYIDGTGFITAIELDPTSAAVRIHGLLAVPLTTTDGNAFEYPDAAPVTSREWLINDGRGQTYTLLIDKSSSTWRADVRPAYHVADVQGALVPFRLLAVQPGTAGGAVVLYSTSSRESPERSDPVPEETPMATDSNVRLPPRSKTTFRFQLARLDPLPAGSTSSVPMQPLWSATSEELPAFVQYDASLQRFAIGSGCRVQIASEESVVEAGTESRSNTESSEDVDMRQEQTDSRRTVTDRQKPPPFSWTQDRDSVTVAFPLPSDTPTSSIRLTLSRQYVTLHVASAMAALSPSTPISAIVPRLSHKKLWDVIDPNTSVWTFDREAEGRNSTFGLLTLHLEKGHPGTRWADVFETVPRAGDSTARIQELDPDEDYENVPETLDASELAAISERMEQWAQSIMGSGPSALSHSAEGLGSGIPTSLTGDEIDVEVDGDTGKPFIVTWIENALTASPQTVCPHPSVPHSLLSTPFPTPSPRHAATIAVQHDVDGLFFQAPTAADEYRWRHTSTFPALAFVLATKRDTRFVHHLDERACFAFDAPALLPGPARTRPFGGAGNAFIYICPEDPKAKQGIQHVVKVGSQSSGALLGVISTRLVGGEPVIIALCEHELVTLHIFG